MVFPDRQKKPIRFLPGWTTQIVTGFWKNDPNRTLEVSR